MSYSALTNQYRPSSQRSSRQDATIDTILWHHQAGTSDDSVIAQMISGARRVSSNYTISNEGRITCVVDEEDRAWTSGSVTDGGRGAAWDRRSITVEIENESGAPDWRISDRAIDAAQRLRADLHSRHRIGQEYGHRDLYQLFRASYPTFCPGPHTVARITSGALPSTPIIPAQPSPSVPVGQSGVDYQFGLTSTAVLATQRGLARLGRYSGDVDGIAGPMTVRALQQWLKDNGHLAGSYVVDGVPGPLYGKALQRVAQAHGYAGPLDGVPGPATSAALVEWAESLAPAAAVRPPSAEGAAWSWWEPSGELAKRVQRALALRNDRFGGVERYSGPIDGVFGPNTRRGVQITLAQSGLHSGDVDGSMERDEAVGVQEYARRFGGYAGPIDGAPREMSWSGFAIGLERR